MTSEDLQRAISLIRSGHKENARPILTGIVKREPDSQEAWSWLYVCVETREQKIYCIQRVLKINPANEKARAVLARMQQPATEQTENQRPTAPHHTQSISPKRKNSRLVTRFFSIALIAAASLAVCLLGLALITMIVADFSPPKSDAFTQSSRQPGLTHRR